MPTKTKTKKRTTNRRKSEKSLLNVTLRSDQARAQRNKTLTNVAGALFGVIFIVLLVWRGIDIALDEFVYSNPAFNVRKLEVSTDGYLTHETILHWADVKTDDNLMALDLNHIKRNLERVPVIKTASLERILPDVLRVRVAERKPVARVTMVLPYSGGYYPATIPLDSKGYVLVPLQNNHVRDARVLNYGALPELKGVDETELRTSGLLQSPNVLAALRLVDDFRRSPLVGTVRMKAIDIAPSGILTVTTEVGSRIKFSSEHEFLPQILRWQQIHNKGRDAGQEIVEVDLSITNHVPAKFRTASASARTPAAAVRTGSRVTNPRNA